LRKTVSAFFEAVVDATISICILSGLYRLLTRSSGIGFVSEKGGRPQ
jgi:hypothetical protein